MKRALLALLWLLAGAGPAFAQGLHAYPPDVVGVTWNAVGAPTTGCWARNSEIMDTNNDVWICTVAGCPGTWATLGGGGVAGITAAGTISDEWTTNTDGALGTAEDATLWLKAGDGSVLHTLSLLMDTSADLAIFDYAAGGGTWSFLQAVAVTGGLTVATGNIVLSGVGATVDGVDVGALYTSFLAFTSTTAPTLTLNSDAVAGTPETVAIVMKSATGVVVPNVTIEANSSGNVYLYANPAGFDVSPTVVIGQSDDYQGTGADVDAALYWSGHQAGDAVGTKTNAYIALDSATETFVITPPTGGSTSINGGNLALTTGSVTLAALAQVDGRDVSVDGSKLDGIEAGADDVNATSVGNAGGLINTTCAAADTVWGCTANDTAGILTGPQLRAAAGIDGIQRAAAPVWAQPDGADNTATVSQETCAGADCYVLVTIGAASTDYTMCHPFTLDAWAAAFDSSAAATLRYKVTATGKAKLEVYDANDVAGTPCYVSGEGSSASFATLTATAADLSSCTIPTSGFLRVCGRCNGTTADTCFLSTVTSNVE